MRANPAMMSIREIKPATILPALLVRYLLTLRNLPIFGYVFIRRTIRVYTAKATF